MGWLAMLRGSESIPGTQHAHPKLGMLEYAEEGWWSGEKTIDGGTIQFFIDDSGKGIDEDLCNYCVGVLANFADYLEKANELIESALTISREEVLKRFTPTEVWSFWKHGGKRGFNMSFRDEKDEFALWRVQFDDGIATYLACDR
jgi:hypothetical protein